MLVTVIPPDHTVTEIIETSTGAQDLVSGGRRQGDDQAHVPKARVGEGGPVYLTYHHHHRSVSPLAAACRDQICLEKFMWADFLPQPTRGQYHRSSAMLWRRSAETPPAQGTPS
ncbi:OLC1v1035140C1 [Oldenlandia corymbosa var. corymbosa]|uniref:OLC1v1035140C1 n=1 Tax=Oldenlandia corymbosa var. corymbosa TaxID=529605 RepID=A0AAV1CST3_OLDCO|nr:OLC1v1035140C1 [Oldenlandia corymbosa var. corymbosa]